MSRNILLVEPNYKNKYPPMSLMKISSYYKMLGDNVTFFKGNLDDLVLENVYELCKEQLYANNSDIFWELYKPQICTYLKKGKESVLEEIPEYEGNPIIKGLFSYYRKFYYRKEYLKPEFRKYDRVCITTLFTFYWDITIDTINYAKCLCKTEDGVKVGGVMASILAPYVEEATGIKPHIGTLASPGDLGDDNDIIIDSLPLDYSILEEIDYEYPASNAYYAYMSRGCINKCKFCAVPKLEPIYKSYLPVSEQVKKAEAIYGAKQNLLLLDNNVLASVKFKDIIEDIKRAGFGKNDTYVPANQFEMAISNLKSGQNDRGYVKLCVKIFNNFLRKSKYKDIQHIYELLADNYLLEEHTAKKDTILALYDELKPAFENFFSTRPKKRYVDFNQGIDSRLITDENMEKLAEIPIKPVRIAFDHWELHKIYESAVRTAVRHGHKDLSNYILYNFEDKPIDLYYRLKLNVDLCEELEASIYSFPMKYHPIEDPDYFSNRDYIGKHWNRKFIRTIQAVLNSTKGKVGRGLSFFCKAFGSNEEEFFKLLYMPEAMIVYRLYFEEIGLTEEWWKAFSSLTKEEMDILKPIVEKNDFSNYEETCTNENVLNVLKYYRVSRSDAQAAIKNNIDIEY